MVRLSSCDDRARSPSPGSRDLEDSGLHCSCFLRKAEAFSSTGPDCGQGRTCRRLNRCIHHHRGGQRPLWDSPIGKNTSLGTRSRFPPPQQAINGEMGESSELFSFSGQIPAVGCSLNWGIHVEPTATTQGNKAPGKGLQGSIEGSGLGLNSQQPSEGVGFGWTRCYNKTMASDSRRKP